MSTDNRWPYIDDLDIEDLPEIGDFDLDIPIVGWDGIHPDVDMDTQWPQCFDLSTCEKAVQTKALMMDNWEKERRLQDLEEVTEMLLASYGGRI